MKKYVLIVLLLLFLAGMVRAEYMENIKEGNLYYKLGEYSEAIKYYIKAYREKPGTKLKAFILSLKKKIDQEAPGLPVMQSGLPEPVKPNNESINKWIVIGGDVVTTVCAIYFYTEAQRWATLEKQYHDEWWDGYGSMDAWQKMVEAGDNSFANTALFIYVGGAALALLGHTVVDMLVLHGTFPQDLKTAVVPEPNGAKLSLNYSF